MSYKYTAFISYNSKDDKVARWLQKRLESYSLPSVLANESGIRNKLEGNSRRRFRIFRYVTDFVAKNINDVTKELDQSKYLIVVCSPNSANAPWVRTEVGYFIANNRKNDIIPFVVNGIPYSNKENECFTPELKSAFPDGSALGVSLNDCGDDLWIFHKRKAIAKVIALLLDIPNAYDFIWKRYKIVYIETLLFRFLLGLIFCLAIIFTAKYIENKEKPFDGKISVKFIEESKFLPPIKSIEIKLITSKYVRVDTILDIKHSAVYPQIPGSLKGSTVRIIAKNIDCLDVDTTLQLGEFNNISLRRNPKQYGEISAMVLKNEEPLVNANLLIDGLKCKTDNKGYVKVSIPLLRQKNKYSIIYSRNYKGVIFMPCKGTTCIILR